MLSKKQIMKLCKSYYFSLNTYKNAYKPNPNVRYFQDAIMKFQHKYDTCLTVLQFYKWTDYQKALFYAWIEDKDIKQVIREYEDVIKGYQEE